MAMDSKITPSFRTFVAECLRQAPASWRKGAIAMSALISGVFFIGLFLGWRFNAYPTSTFLVGSAVIAAVDIFVLFPFHLWKADKNTIAALQDRLAPKIRLYLRADPLGQTTGIEIAKGPQGQDLNYVQVCVEPEHEMDIYDGDPFVTKIEHRNFNESPFSEVFSEPLLISWSWLPHKTTLSKGKPSRFNIVAFENRQSALYSVVDPTPNKLGKYYASPGKGGEYRYTVHVEGRGVAPANAHVYVQWRARGYPIVTLAPVDALGNSQPPPSVV